MSKTETKEIINFVQSVYDQCTDKKMTCADFELFVLLLTKHKQSAICEVNEKVKKTLLPVRKGFFTCLKCGRALCQKKDLEQFADDYCIHCGYELTSAKKETMALVGEDC